MVHKLVSDRAWAIQALFGLTIALLWLPRAFAVTSTGLGGVTVTTASGPVRGEKQAGVLVFRGIRYAQPPVGNLRFQPASPQPPWTDTQLAFDFAPACPQMVYIDPSENNN